MLVRDIGYRASVSFPPLTTHSNASNRSFRPVTALSFASGSTTIDPSPKWTFVGIHSAIIFSAWFITYASWRGAEKGPAGGKRTLKGRVISSLQRKPEPKAFLNYLIFKVKHWTPAFAGVTARRVFTVKWEFQSFFSTLLEFNVFVLLRRRIGSSKRYFCMDHVSELTHCVLELFRLHDCCNFGKYEFFRLRLLLLGISPSAISDDDHPISFIIG